MKQKSILVLVMVVLVVANIASATTDTFGTGANQFTIDFVNISGDASSANGTNISLFTSGSASYRTFTDPGDYRIGTYEITNAQWNKFVNAYGTVTGSPSSAYDYSPSWTGTDVPTNRISYYEGAQFVNWLNTSKGYSQAYKFTGTQGMVNYAFVPWESGDSGYDADNPFRNSDAYYFLPTEDEWVKAAYWNGTNLQTYATIGDSIPVAGVDTNYDVVGQPWPVGIGSEELNDTFDMMGNAWEWSESPFYSGDYLSGSDRVLRGGSYGSDKDVLSSVVRERYQPFDEGIAVGFRVASVPEPATLLLLGLGAVMLRRKR